MLKALIAVFNVAIRIFELGDKLLALVFERIHPGSMNSIWHCEEAAVAEASVWCFLSRIALHGVSVLLHYSRKA